MKVSTKFVTGPIDNLFDPKLGIYLPSYEEEKERIVTFQELALRRKNMKYPFSCLQAQLFEAMLREQQFLKVLKENPIAELPENRQNMFLEKASLPLYAMREIANGMGFRFMDYNLALMQAIGNVSNGVDDLSSEGIMHELDYFGALSDVTPPNKQVFLCSLCDLVGTGDILTKDENEFEVIEVKKGHPRGARITRQKEKLKSLEEFFKLKSKTIEGHELKLIELPTRKHHCSLLNDAINNCLQNSISSFSISDYQLVYCLNTRDNQNLSQEKIDYIYSEVEKAFGKRFMDFISTKFMYKTGLSVPFSAFPISSENLAELLLGGVIFFSFISLDSLEKHINDKGWKFVNIIKETAEKDILSSPIYIVGEPNNPEHNFTIPVDYLMDCGLNFIDLDCLLDNSIYISNNYSGFFTACYKDEFKIWK